jgi:hypothetical protein
MMLFHGIKYLLSSQNPNFVISMNLVEIEMLNQKSIETCSILTKNSIPLIKFVVWKGHEQHEELC